MYIDSNFFLIGNGRGGGGGGGGDVGDGGLRRTHLNGLLGYLLALLNMDHTNVFIHLHV